MEIRNHTYVIIILPYEIKITTYIFSTRYLILVLISMKNPPPPLVIYLDFEIVKKRKRIVEISLLELIMK